MCTLSTFSFFREPFWLPETVLGMLDDVQRERRLVLSVECEDAGLGHGTPDIRRFLIFGGVACDRQSGIR